MLARDLECGRHLSLFLALPHQGGIAASAQRQCKRIKQDRLASAGFAGKHSKPADIIDVELVDQHDVADGEAGQHDSASSKTQRAGTSVTAVPPTGRPAAWPQHM